ncbi:hypothetical protein CTM97_12780 [Photobacterium phosphoreum]|uniref:DUF1561 domain-containing protein n=1 Tax=Photobacterium phosphoreum TaxID=659 RepID=A0A2T3JQI5_PHOPO|nr:DUF1561 family protein [Photobacterium phosphoreum]PSU27159.1 hypothetical protein CTM96_00005 [Photobacterium phosphoreum]PSU41464.1 hypothetical protein CTM97_12780 [Photobacterium phosphoreum]PSU51341.1 hypothetical protein C9J18_12910 [Photobacterium phosphoreum]
MNIHGIKEWPFVSFILFILFYIGISFSVNAANPTPPPPKPVDSWLVLTLHDNKYACVYKNRNDQAALYRGKQWSDYCQWFRYDQFSRLSIRQDGTEFCLTIPDSLTSSGTVNWDYLEFKTCVVGDYKQVWSVNKDEPSKPYIFNARKKWRVLDFNWALYVSKTGATYNKNYLPVDRSDIKNLLATPSRPASYSIPLALLWAYQTVSYELFDGTAKAVAFNSDKKTILNEKGECLKSNLDATGVSNWEYVSFVKCPDTLTNQFKWDISLTSTPNNNAKYIITDHNKNQLMNTRDGTDWGYPFVASAKYVVSSNGEKYNKEYDSIALYKDGFRQLGANSANSGSMCNTRQDWQRRILPVPPELLSDIWLQRLYEIATSTPSSAQSDSVGYCGICALQSMEMISQIALTQFTGGTNPPEHYSWMQPAPGVDPFIYFRSAFVSLSDSLQRIMDDTVTQLRTSQEFSSTNESIAYFSTISRSVVTSFFPDNEFSGTTVPHPIHDSNFFNSMLAQPVGTVWAGATTLSAMRQSGRHLVVFYRGDQGIHIIPTALSGRTVSRDAFMSRARTAYTGRDEFILELSSLVDGGLTTIDALVLYRLGWRIPDSIYSILVSFEGCDGEGRGRRGNGGFSRANLLNRCDVKDRCNIM